MIRTAGQDQATPVDGPAVPHPTPGVTPLPVVGGWARVEPDGTIVVADCRSILPPGDVFTAADLDALADLLHQLAATARAGASHPGGRR